MACGQSTEERKKTCNLWYDVCPDTLTRAPPRNRKADAIPGPIVHLTRDHPQRK